MGFFKTDRHTNLTQTSLPPPPASDLSDVSADDELYLEPRVLLVQLPVHDTAGDTLHSHTILSKMFREYCATRCNSIFNFQQKWCHKYQYRFFYLKWCPKLQYRLVACNTVYFLLKLCLKFQCPYFLLPKSGNAVFFISSKGYQSALLSKLNSLTYLKVVVKA